ncbi:hypothetical protein G6F63_015829 [Rhizopus arrhizus]|nr:hypothetical protein G6F63_015829 [Rhizopus arrhizus]
MWAHRCSVIAPCCCTFKGPTNCANWWGNKPQCVRRELLANQSPAPATSAACSRYATADIVVAIITSPMHSKMPARPSAIAAADMSETAVDSKAPVITTNTASRNSMLIIGHACTRRA